MLNHVGSFPAMEAEGALRLWQRFILCVGLCYTSVISDHDFKAFATLCDAYGGQCVSVT